LYCTCDHCRADAHPERHPEELTTDEGTSLLASDPLCPYVPPGYEDSLLSQELS
jgi:MoaA/NifB/PqqE/SkfB family radical SAM enzyme